MGFKKPERKRFTGLGFERAGLGNYRGSGGEGTSEQEQHGHRGWQRQWRSSDVLTEELMMLRRGKRAPQGRTAMDGRKPEKGECTPSLASTSAPITARKITGKEKKTKQIPILLNIPGRKITQRKKTKQNKKQILPLHLERDRDISLNAINLHRPKH